MNKSLLIILIILIVFNCLNLNFYLREKNKRENMTDSNNDDTSTGNILSDTIIDAKIKDSISKIYKADLESVRNLSLIATKLQEGTLTIPGNLSVKGSFNYLPKGTIVAYQGSEAPAGWALCDGVNGRPDLRGRFILGSGSGGLDTNKDSLTKRTVGESGGFEKVKLTINELPSHTHNMTLEGEHSHTSSLRRWERSFKGDGSSSTSGKPVVADSGQYDYNPTTSSAGKHTHTIYKTGRGDAHENMSPFYVLTYIIKL